jgi:putative ABC transport system permease protein
VTAGFLFRSALRECRGLRSRLVLFVACLAVGVAAVVALAGFSQSLDDALRAEARRLLAGDVAVDARIPLPPELDRVLATDSEIRRSDVRRLPTVLSRQGEEGRPGASQLVELKVVDREYPFYGTVRLEPDGRLAELLDERTTAVAPELAQKLRVAIGDSLRIGRSDFRIVAIVRYEPDRVDFGFSIGPRVFLSPPAFERAGLVAYGSQMFHRALLKLPAGADAVEAKALAERIQAALPNASAYEIQTYADAQPALRAGLQKAERFLGLVVLLSLLIGGIGIAQTVRSWLAGRFDSIAVLKCLGFRPRDVLALYVGQTVLLGLLGSVVGVAAGVAVLEVVPRALGGLAASLPIELWQPAAFLRGIGLGVAIAVVFALPAILVAGHVPPLRVMRRDVQPLPASQWARSLVLAVAVFATAWVQSRSAFHAAAFAGGLGAVVGSLALAARLLTRAVGRAPRRFTRVWARHGLAAIARPGADTLGSIVALGLGMVVVLTMVLVEGDLRSSLRAELPADAPTTFFADIQPDQWPTVRAALERGRATNLRSVPLVSARLVSVDGRSTEELAAAHPEDRGRKWTLTREQNLTYLAELPDDNRLVAGSWWRDPERAELSIEREFAENLRAGVGSALVFDVQGVEIELTVASLREIEWRSFRPNFFLVVEPGVLEQAPQRRVAAARLDAAARQAIQDELAVVFPNVLTIEIREALDKVARILDRVTTGVRFLGGFTVLAAIAILAGAVGAGSVRRAREIALLKTLGMTRGGVVAVFTVEYALLGLVAGVVGALGGGILAWLVVTQWLDLDWNLRAAPYAATIAASVGVSTLAVVLATAAALIRRPMDVLRDE